ncbi:MAG: hypothetical protein ACRC8S_10745 [Fimbriiglobus sp.]
MEKSEDFPRLFGISFFIGILCITAFSEFFRSNPETQPANTTVATNPLPTSDKPTAPESDELEPELNEPDPGEYRRWVENNLRDSGPPYQWTSDMIELTDNLVATSGLPETTVKKTPLNKMVQIVRKAKPTRGFSQKDHEQYVDRLEEEYGRMMISIDDFHKLMCIRRDFHNGKTLPDADIKFMRNVYRKFALAKEEN